MTCQSFFHSPRIIKQLRNFLGCIVCTLVLVGLLACQEECPRCPQENSSRCNTTQDASFKEQSSPPESKSESSPEPPPSGSSVTCTPPSRNFYQYVSPPSLKQVKAGTPLQCELLGTRTSESLSKDPAFLTSGSQARFGMAWLRFSYQTQAPKGTPQIATATLYIPLNAQGQCTPNTPVAQVLHGTVGTADLCAPSRTPQWTQDYMAYPLIGRGYLVVAPDYIGLGRRASIGHPYLVAEPTAIASIDALRAARALLQQGAYQGCMGKRVLLLGHSQGGHAALAVAERIQSEAPAFQHAGTIAYAPAFGSANVWAGPLKKELKTTAGTAYLVAFLRSTARYAQRNEAKELTPKAARFVDIMLDQLCFAEFSRWLIAHYPTLGALFSSEFLDASAACNGGKGDCSRYQPWWGEIQRALVGGFKTQAPTLLVQGGKDTLVTANSVSCIADRLQQKGSPSQRCMYPNANHTTIVGAAWPALLNWIESAMKGTNLPTLSCPQNTLPPCVP